MKKIVGTIAAAALVASAAFAGVGIGSWGRGVWTPVAYDDADGKMKSWEGVSWGGSTVRTGISIHGESENIGFNIDMNADGNKAGIGDTAYFWAKPWSFLEMKMGKVQDDTGRGNVAFGMFDWKRMGAGWTGEDVTFTRFGNGSGGQANGAILKVTPVEGLWAIACFDVQDDKEAAKTYGNHAQYGVGYDISGIGSVRAQYIGKENITDKDGTLVGNGQLNAAFDLTAVENLRVTVGAYIPFGMKASASERVKLAAGADFTVGTITLHALFVGNFANTVEKYTNNFDSQFGIGADFDLGNGISAQADIRYSTAQTHKNDGGDTYINETSETVFLVGLKKGLTNGYVGVGLQGDIKGNLKNDLKAEDGARFNWCVPVVVSAWF